MSKTTNKFSPEVRERAVRMVSEHRAGHRSEWDAMVSIAGKIGCTAETLRRWCRDEAAHISSFRDVVVATTAHTQGIGGPAGPVDHRFG